jgi:hypothetical protein
VKRKTHLRAPEGATTSHNPRPSPWRPGFVFATARAVICAMALAHAVESKTEAAYFRSDLFDKRRKLMELWALMLTI